MKRTIFALLLCAVTLGAIAQPTTIYPRPQAVNHPAETGTLNLAGGVKIQKPHEVDSMTLVTLSRLADAAKRGIPITITQVGSRTAKSKFKEISIPEISGAYHLRIDKKGIAILGHDHRATFYAIQTLRQLISADHTVPFIEITDYPNIAFRGVVEGFYGTPWSHEDRIAQLEFYGRNKLNTYIYGPKDDPYHSSLSGHSTSTNTNKNAGWRVPYPPTEAARIKELVKVAHQNKVDFVWAIHPGQDIQWNEADYKLLLAKFESMYNLGVRSFAVFFDDISGQGTQATKQAQLLNRINTEFILKKGDITPLIMCPTEYNKAWSNHSLTDGYLAILGRELHPSIQIMWTGDSVCANIDMNTLRWVNERIQRPAYIWWNFPVTDYVRTFIAQGPSTGLGLDITNQDMFAFVSNPMEHAEASRIALFGVADYAWNVAGYQHLTTWEEAIRRIMPQAANHYRTFAIHSADFAKNYHKFNRPESWETTTLDYQNYTPATFDSLHSEFKAITAAGPALLASGGNQNLLQELKPWLLQFTILGQRGEAVMQLIKLRESGTTTQLWRAILELEMNSTATAKFNAHKAGTLILRPFISSTIEGIGADLLHRISGTPKKDSTPVHKTPILHSNIEQLAALTPTTTGQKISLPSLLEVIRIETGQYIGIELPVLTNIQNITANLGTKALTPQFSTNGTDWTTTPPKATKFIRYTNLTPQTIEAKLRKFEVEAAANSSNDTALAFDQNLSTGFEITHNQKITIPLPQGHKTATIFSQGNVMIGGKTTEILDTINITDLSEITFTGWGSVREIILH